MDKDYMGWEIIRLETKRSVNWKAMFFVSILLWATLLTKILLTTIL